MDEKVENLVKWLNDQYGPEWLFTFEKLKVRYRVIHQYSNNTSVYCFVDFEGNIYKADTWNRPAKHVRGHVDNLNTYDLGKYSPRYLK